MPIDEDRVVLEQQDSVGEKQCSLNCRHKEE